MTVSFFDGHNDMLLRLWHNDDWGATAFLESDGSGHIDRERMAAAHMIGGFFAIFIPADKTDMLAAGLVDQKRALIQCLEMIDIFDMLISTDFALATPDATQVEGRKKSAPCCISRGRR